MIGTLISAADAAALLGISPRTIYKWVKKGRLTPKQRKATHAGPHPRYLFEKDEVIAAGKLLDHAAQELGRRQARAREVKER